MNMYNLTGNKFLIDNLTKRICTLELLIRLNCLSTGVRFLY